MSHFRPDIQEQLIELGCAIQDLTEEWDQAAYDNGDGDGQWPSACDFIERVFEARIRIIGSTEAYKKHKENQ
jgi:ribonucleotide reductase beta subunit family protein with ferritin-like domain